MIKLNLVYDVTLLNLSVCYLRYYGASTENRSFSLRYIFVQKHSFVGPGLDYK